MCMSLAKAIDKIHTNPQRLGGLPACAAAAALDPGSDEMNGWCTVQLACHVVGRTVGGLGDGCTCYKHSEKLSNCMASLFPLIHEFGDLRGGFRCHVGWFW